VKLTLRVLMYRLHVFAKLANLEVTYLLDTVVLESIASIQEVAVRPVV
jgi:hypothetical protein